MRGVLAGQEALCLVDTSQHLLFRAPRRGCREKIVKNAHQDPNHIKRKVPKVSALCTAAAVSLEPAVFPAQYSRGDRPTRERAQGWCVCEGIVPCWGGAFSCFPLLSSRHLRLCDERIEVGLVNVA